MHAVKMLSCVVPFVAACVACSSPPPTANAPEATEGRAVVFEGARLIDGEEFLPIEDSAFIVEGGKFTAVGRKGEVDIPAGAVRVDLTGKTVMPGLIELHGHFGYWKGGVDTSATYFTRETILDQLDRYAYSGFSAVLSLGVDQAGDVAYKVRDESPLPGKPIFRTAGQGLVSPGGGPTDTLAKGVITVATEAEARKAVRELAAKKADFVKFWAGVRRLNEPGANVPPAARMVVYRAIIDEAHKHNMKTTVDVRLQADIKELMRAGVDSFAPPCLG